MSKTKTVSVEIDNELHAVTLTAEEWQAVGRGEQVHKEVEEMDAGEVITYIYSFNPKNYKADSLVVEYSDGGVAFVGTLAEAHIYSVADLN